MTRRPIVSDHALLRYLERVAGIDVTSHRHAVEDLVASAVDKGACGLISGGHRYVLRGDRVTTVIPRHQTPGVRMMPDDDFREG